MARGRRGKATLPDDVGLDDDRGEKTLGRRPEGPAYPRTAGTVGTLKRTVTEFGEDNGTIWAAALTYYGLLAVFPALLALVSLVGIFFDPKQVTGTLTDMVRQLGPTSAVKTLQGPINSVTANQGTAGLLVIGGLVLALWSASGYIGAFTKAANVIWEVEEGRPFYVLRPVQMLVTLVQVLLLALVAVGVVATGPVAHTLGNAVGAGSLAVTVWSWAKWPVMVAVVLMAIALLYHAAPNAKQRGFKASMPGALLAVAVWLVASAAFAFYVANFGSYNKTYGTIGGMICFLVWYWITNIAVVLGAEFNAERERAREIEEGAPGAERELQVDLRREPRLKRKSRTA
jgi:membrane protein